MEEFPRWFRTGEVHAIEEGGRVFLVGAAFQRLSRAEDVVAAGEAALVRMFGVAALLVNNLRRPAIAGVIKDDDEGRHQFLFASGAIEMRAKASLGVVSTEAGDDSASLTQAENMLKTATSRPGLEHALDLWGNGTLTWPRLYRLLEELEDNVLTMTADKAGFCSKTQRSRFTQTAQNSEAAGLDARHAAGYCPPLLIR